MNRRTLLVTVGWLGAAVVAVLVGLAAISVIGNGLTSPATRPLSAAQVDEQLARESTATPRATAATGNRPDPPASPAPVTGTADTFLTSGGTVVGRCAGSRPEVVSMSPKQGYELHEQDRGPQEDDAEGEFRSRRDSKDRFKFEIVCAGGAPRLVRDTDD